MNRSTSYICVLSGLALTMPAFGQSSSLLYMPPQSGENNEARLLPARPTIGGPSYVVVPPAEETRAATRWIERASFIAVPLAEPRRFHVHDLVTIIVRQQKRYKGEQDYDKEKKWDIDGKLSEWFRLYPDHKLGTDHLTNGQPGFQFSFNDKYENEGGTERKDEFTTRITASIIDVKPNGNLILEAKNEQEHDEDGWTLTLTGECRSRDVTPDNTILSTQVANLVVNEKNHGAVRDAAARGWIPKILDFAKPF